ncbi:cytochrome aa3 quinol oxidase subunit IV [Terrilactibacillus sp. S3-3]|nr:cytochrome aa3 quinol oxidase subunit IV [Terrilactibacillus sp. S3-3]
MQENGHVNISQAHRGFPWKHVIGLILSLALTMIALWVAVYMTLPGLVTLTIIVVLALLQALIQLFMFMHLSEATAPWIQNVGIIFGVFTAFAVVAGSIWIMWFTL